MMFLIRGLKQANLAGQGIIYYWQEGAFAYAVSPRCFLFSFLLDKRLKSSFIYWNRIRSIITAFNSHHHEQVAKHHDLQADNKQEKVKNDQTAKSAKLLSLIENNAHFILEILASFIPCLVREKV